MNIEINDQQKKFLMELLDEKLSEEGYSQTSYAIMNQIYQKLIFKD